MATTTNFGWETPDDTDLVKDGAAAIRTALGGVDTSFVDLKGGTTGQVLAKASNTDLDFVWSADASGIPATIFDAKGDIIAASAADTAARLAVGTNGQVLTADSTAATGLKWASASAAKNYSLLNTGGTALSGATTITVSGISGKDSFLVLIDGAGFSAGSQADVTIRINGDTASNYASMGATQTFGGSYIAGNYEGATVGPTNRYYIGTISQATDSRVYAGIEISGGNSSGVKVISNVGSGTQGSSNGMRARFAKGYWNNSATITSISVFAPAGDNFTAGTIYVYGA